MCACYSKHPNISYCLGFLKASDPGLSILYSFQFNGQYLVYGPYNS